LAVLAEAKKKGLIPGTPHTATRDKREGRFGKKLGERFTEKEMTKKPPTQKGPDSKTPEDEERKLAGKGKRALNKRVQGGRRTAAGPTVW